MSTTPLTPAQDGAQTGSTGQAGSALDQSRARSQRAQQSLADARRRMDEIDARIGRNTARTSADENALRVALEEVKRLKKALKDGEKERRKLVTDRKRAAAAREKAEDKASKAEAKYDRAVLADMIQREKEQGREAAIPTTGSGAPASSGQEAPAAVPGGPAASVGDTAASVGDTAASVGDTAASAGDGTEPASEPEDLATATARATAARATAASAGEAAQPAPKPPTPRRATTPRTSTPRTTTPRARTPRSSSEPGPATGGGQAEA